MSSETVEFYKTVFPNLSGLIEEKEFAKVSVVRLTGNAGMGKTHYYVQLLKGFAKLRMCICSLVAGF